MIAEVLMLLGSIVYVIAAFGVLRLPDLYQRMQAATKAGTAASSLILVGFIVHVRDPAVGARAAAAIAFLFMTLPVASFVLGRIAWIIKQPISEDTKVEP